MLGEGQFLLLALKLGVLNLERLDLGGEPGLACQRLTRKILAPHLDRLLCLRLQLHALLLELGDLQLDPLATGGDVGHPAAYLREQIELALIAVVESFARVLGAVQRLIGLGPEDQGDALPQTHGMRPFSCVSAHGASG